MYVEIGSTEVEWRDMAAGELVARAILKVREDPDAEVYVGIGGNHYAPRETALSFDANAAFGHIVADHAIPLLDEPLLRGYSSVRARSLRMSTASPFPLSSGSE